MCAPKYIIKMLFLVIILVATYTVRGCWVERVKDAVLLYGCDKRTVQYREHCDGAIVKGHCMEVEMQCLVAALATYPQLRVSGARVCGRHDANGQPDCYECTRGSWLNGQENAIRMVQADEPPPPARHYSHRRVDVDSDIARRLATYGLDTDRDAECEAVLTTCTNTLADVKEQNRKLREKLNAPRYESKKINLIRNIEFSVVEDFHSTAVMLLAGLENKMHEREMETLYRTISLVYRRLRTYRNAIMACSNGTDLTAVDEDVLRRVYWDVNIGY
ncbi:capsid protein [Probopyrinella latreuticola Nege-like virus]|nr:capsid protein [Probopyrinella latreuticola Nege-like virus]